VGRRHYYPITMNKTALIDQLMQLPPEERVEIAYQLWESVPASSDDLELTEEQKAELDRRMAEYERDPSRAIPLEQFLARIQSLSE
jgi:putative addiction module component (TIGR02574 family)